MDGSEAHSNPESGIDAGVNHHALQVSDHATPQPASQAADTVHTFLHCDMKSVEFQAGLTALGTLGATDMTMSTALSARMLARPEAAKQKLDNKGGVAKGLSDLRSVIENLDPSRPISPRRILGLIPFGSKLRSYFDRYTSAQGQLDAILTSLYRGKDDLMRDNAAIEQEKASLDVATERIREAVSLCEYFDQELSRHVDLLTEQGDERATVLRDEALLTVRQRRVDLLTQTAVNLQAYHVLDILKKNNVELIRGVDRATTTTLSALRTAVIAAQALAGQRLVLQQVTVLNDTTGAMIEATSKMLGEQGAQIQQQAAESTVDLDRLKAAFVNIYAALDAVDTYKAQAVKSLAASADALQVEISNAE